MLILIVKAVCIQPVMELLPALAKYPLRKLKSCPENKTRTSLLSAA